MMAAAYSSPGQGFGRRGFRMSHSVKRTIVVAVATAFFMLGALAAFGVEDVTTGPPTDGTTEATLAPVAAAAGGVVIGEIRTSSISFERRVAETTITYVFVYSGPGSIDFDFDDPDGCLVAFRGVTSTAIKHCAR